MIEEFAAFPAGDHMILLDSSTQALYSAGGFLRLNLMKKTSLTTPVWLVLLIEVKGYMIDTVLRPFFRRFSTFGDKVFFENKDSRSLKFSKKLRCDQG